MAQNWGQDNKGSLQWLTGAHLDRMSDTICDSQSDDLKLDQEVLWLDVLGHPVLYDSQEFKDEWEALMAEEPRPGTDPEVARVQRRYKQCRLIVKWLYKKNVLRRAEMPVDDMEDFE